ncbi:MULTISPECIES: hypothetical protein [unclassified Nocardiopsis]|uniref:hypothetical protein n=1 Tax=unclassified Nocardiopsis TaxID=2649073 RepID=UPI00135B3986|nr:MULTISPECIES: hypothetical protein [unclassified Nocardiopsis]
MDSEREWLLTVVPEDWDVTATGDLVTPCGEVIEQDGECPCGEHTSPLRLLGLI